MDTLKLTGRLIEIGNLNGGSIIGASFNRGEGRYLDITLLSEDEARALAPAYDQQVTITIGLAERVTQAPAQSGEQKTGHNYGEREYIAAANLAKHLHALYYREDSPTGGDAEGVEMNLHEEIACADKLNAAYKARIAELEAQLAARQPSDLQAAILARDKFERMFVAACEDLAAINENLGLDPDDGGAEPIIAAIEELRVAASHAVVGQQWQPIETAPKDGTRIIIFMGAPWARIVTVRWFDLWENWQEGDFPEDHEEYCGIGSEVPTHWMPLPPAPQPAQQDSA